MFINSPVPPHMHRTWQRATKQREQRPEWSFQRGWGLGIIQPHMYQSVRDWWSEEMYMSRIRLKPEPTNRATWIWAPRDFHWISCPVATISKYLCGHSLVGTLALKTFWTLKSFSPEHKLFHSLTSNRSLIRQDRCSHCDTCSIAVTLFSSTSQWVGL